MRRWVILCCLMAAVGIVAADDVASNGSDLRLVPGTRVSPEYPPAALAARFEGTVVLAVVVLPDGTVGEIEIVESTHPKLGFEEAAIEAVRQWEFEPGRQGGEPVTSVTAYALSFRVPPPGRRDSPFVAGIHLASTAAVRGPVVGFPSQALADNGFAPNRWIGRTIWAVEIPGCGHEMCVYDRADFKLKPDGRGVFYPMSSGGPSEVSSGGRSKMSQ